MHGFLQQINPTAWSTTTMLHYPDDEQCLELCQKFQQIRKCLFPGGFRFCWMPPDNLQSGWDALLTQSGFIPAALTEPLMCCDGKCRWESCLCRALLKLYYRISFWSSHWQMTVWVVRFSQTAKPASQLVCLWRNGTRVQKWWDPCLIHVCVFIPTFLPTDKGVQSLVLAKTNLIWIK